MAVVVANTAAALAGQTLGVVPIDLTAQVTGRLPYANLVAATAAARLLGRRSASSGDWEELSLGSGLSLSGTTLSATAVAGTIVQVVNTEDGAVATGTTTIPADDTIPQITEGTQFLSRAITPTSATNKLKIEVVFVGAVATAARTFTVALFQDSTANAIAAVMQRSDTASTFHTVTFTHYMTAGTTSATTFTVRVGVETSGTVTFNGAAGSRFLGGVMASSITITEIAA